LQGTVPRAADFKQNLCANLQGFSLHAAVRCAAHERNSLERLCRYITRPALANERVRCNGTGQVVLTLKTAWRDGTTHLVMSPLEFMQRLAALVPRPRLHLIRFGVRINSLREVSGPTLREHGVLAPSFTQIRQSCARMSCHNSHPCPRNRRSRTRARPCLRIGPCGPVG
jgi:Putative transposase